MLVSSTFTAPFLPPCPPEPTDDSNSEEAKGNQNPSGQARQGAGAEWGQVEDSEAVPAGEQGSVAEEEDAEDDDIWIPQLGKNG